MIIYGCHLIITSLSGKPGFIPPGRQDGRILGWDYQTAVPKRWKLLEPGLG